jgi:DnaK suppressor protein
MDTAKKTIIKNKLESEIRLQKEKIDELERITQPVSPDRAIGRISRMDAIHNKSINEATLNTARERLAKMEHALANIDSPEFGLCEICNEEIMPMRLFEMPEATTCTKCGV